MLPYALAGRDVIGCAETGTGKTAAYVLPILSRLIREDREAGPRASHHATRALILAPTRELATQIDDEIQGFAYHAPVASAAVYGGVPMGPQERALKAGVDIVVATPGRLLDHMRSSVGDFSKLEVFVLDEADRMMDMGFWPDVRKIAEALPPSTRASDDAVLGDDAGRSDAVRRRAGAERGVRAGRIAPRPGADDLARSAHPAVAREGRRSSRSTCAASHEPAIVFVNTKIGCDRLARQLAAIGPARGRDPRRSVAEGSHGGDRELPRRPDQGARRDRRRRARPRHRRRRRSSSTTKCRAASTPTSTASAARAATTPQATRSRWPTRPSATISKRFRRRSV